MTSIADVDTGLGGDVPPSIDEAATIAAARVASALDHPTDNKQYRLSNGVLLRFKPIPPLALQQVASQFEQPQPPMWMNKDKGREELNPVDPEYKKALVEFGQRQFMALVDVILLIGTEVAEVPEGTLPVDSDEWLEPLEALGLLVPVADKYQRRLSWLKLYLIQSRDDLSSVFRAAISAAGVSEAQVAEMIAAFRGNT